MTGRRDFLIGGACLAAAGGAYMLKPRRKLTLLGKNKMSAVVPQTVGSWVSASGLGLVQPETAGRLAAKLYSEIVSRVYVNNDTGDEIMMLIAYGDTQSDLLQLHRPESCYPAVGFRIASAGPAPVPIAAGAAIPGRRVVAERPSRMESIVYWTRLGEFLPDSSGAQRKARLQTAMKGDIPDGALFRFSSLETANPFQKLDDFIAALVLATPPKQRPALIGSDLARRLPA
jgi:EpsI family protein